MTLLNTAEQELRTLLERRQVDMAARFLIHYGDLAATEINLLPPEDPRRAELCKQVVGVLEWADHILQTHRSELNEELRLLRKTDRFLDVRRVKMSCFEMDL